MAGRLLHFNQAQYKRLLDRYGALAAVEFEKQVAISHGVFMKDLIKETAPPNHQAKKSGVSERKLGQRAIQNDMLKIFNPIDAATQKDLMKYNLPADIWDPTGAKMESYHKSKRNPQTGRVNHHKKVRTKRAGGKIEFFNRVYVRTGPFNKRVKELGKRVGRLKRGWIASINGKPITGVPAWITNLPVPLESRFKRSLASHKITYDTSNDVPYAVQRRLALVVISQEEINRHKFNTSMNAVMNHLEKKWREMEAKV